MKGQVFAYEYEIKRAIHSLEFLIDLINLGTDIIILEEFEIEHFVEFSIGFQAEYWYLKYQLIKNEKIRLSNEYQALLNEKGINIIWLNLTDEKSFLLKCIDGSWRISFATQANKVYNFFIQQGFI